MVLDLLCKWYSTGGQHPAKSGQPVWRGRLDTATKDSGTDEPSRGQFSIRRQRRSTAPPAGGGFLHSTTEDCTVGHPKAGQAYIVGRTPLLSINCPVCSWCTPTCQRHEQRGSKQFKQPAQRSEPQPAFGQLDRGEQCCHRHVAAAAAAPKTRIVRRPTASRAVQRPAAANCSLTYASSS